MALLLVVAVGGGAWWAVDRAQGSATDEPAPRTPSASAQASSASSPTPSPTPTMSTPRVPEPSTWMPDWDLPEYEWEELPTADPSVAWADIQVNPINDLTPVVLEGCPAPKTTSSKAQWQEAVLAQWDCVHEAWVPVFERMGWSTVKPPVDFYAGTGADSECGYLEAPAFYCSAGNGAVFFGDGHYEMSTYWDLSVNEMVNHEYGHHLQNVSGITDLRLQLEADDVMQRRVELQATCWSAMMTYRNREVNFDEDDFNTWQERLNSTIDDGIHGSRESLRYWGNRGLYAATLGDCNTWLVHPDDVS